jgi:hypothetical protein
MLPRDRTSRAIDSGHYKSAVPPDEVKALFDRHRSTLGQMYKQDRTWDRIKVNWGEEGSD